MGTLSTEVRDLCSKLSIKELIQGANENHNLAVKAAKGTLMHAKDSGDMLTALKAKCQKGMFQKLIMEDVDGLQMSLRTSQVYMQISREFDNLMEQMSPGQAATISLAEGLKKIKYKKAEYFPDDIASDKDPVDGTEECMHGGPHEYDEEACIRCHDPKPDGETTDAGGAKMGAKSRSGGRSPGNKLGAERDGGIDAGKLFLQAEGHYARLTQLLDQLNQVEPFHDKEGAQAALNMSYDAVTRWRKQYKARIA